MISIKPKYIKDEHGFLIPTKEVFYTIRPFAHDDDTYKSWLNGFGSHMIKEKQWTCQLALSGCILIRSEPYFCIWGGSEPVVSTLYSVKNPWRYDHCEKFWGYEYVDIEDEKQVRKTIRYILNDDGPLDDICELIMLHRDNNHEGGMF